MPANEPEALARRLRALWDDPELRRSDGDALLARARAGHSEQTYVERLMGSMRGCRPASGPPNVAPRPIASGRRRRARYRVDPLVPPGDAVALRRALDALLEHQARLAALRATAHASAQEYGRDAVARSQLALYEAAFKA